uniref:VWFA domain-containing protein n=1 Tax=Panagrolaimus davidi TaxID=227884 RepID=A0A914QPJ0_9BILA
MYFSKLLFLLFTTLALSKVAPSKKSYSCQEPPPHNFTAGCFVDLTIAIDMSLAMKSDANIATLVDSILTDLMPSFNFKETYTAGLAYGALSIGASNYFNNYADICQYIHSAQEQAIQLGLGYANLSEVFETYQITLLNSGRNYKKVLVLLTSVTDAKDIQTAKHFSDQLQASGVIVIVGALGSASATALSQLGNYVIEATGFTLSATNITEDICQYGGITVTPPKPTVHVTSPPSTLPPTTRPPPPPTTTTPAKPPTTTTPSPHLTNHGIGTNCSKNVTNAWLDIALVFDISVAMSDEQLRDMLLETYGYLSKFTLNHIGEHTTRVALIPYADDATVVHSLNDVQSNAALRNALFSLNNRTKPYDFNVNVQNALQVAFDHLQTYVNYRPQIILLTAGAYRKAGFNGASHTADQIKENEITIFTVAFQAPDGVLDRNLSPLASPGYAYNSADKGLYTALPLALTQVNCFCFGGKIQFTVSNATRITKYADCVWGFAGETLPSIVFQYGCDSGVLAAITSQEKLDFVAHKIIPHDLFGRKAFTVGGHKVGEKWVWNGYNGTFPFESFPTFTQVSPADKYSFFDPISSTDFSFKSTGDVARPYLCESRACDADYICDQSSKKRSLKKH